MFKATTTGIGEVKSGSGPRSVSWTKTLWSSMKFPYGTTTSGLIDNILKANEKGKIKIKKIEDNTAASVEIIIHLPNGISPDKTIDALYAFTDCESSISPLGCVIIDNKPHFIGVSEMLNPFHRSYGNPAQKRVGGTVA
jgi:DNA gyrase/topoisomerase IV subunit A